MKAFILLSCLFVSGGVYAQKFFLKLNAGVAVTRIADFQNQIIYVDGLVTPGIIDPSNSLNPPVSTVPTSETVTQSGWMLNLELVRKLNDRWNLAFALGYQHVKFDYDTEVSIPGKPPIYLGSLLNSYGDTKLSYINLCPIGASVSCFKNQLAVQFGPSFNFLVKSKYTNTLIVYEGVPEPNNSNAKEIYFESIGDMSPILYGAYLKTSYTLARRFELFAVGNYYFNSVYGDTRVPGLVLERNGSLQLQFGIGFLLSDFVQHPGN